MSTYWSLDDTTTRVEIRPPEQPETSEIEIRRELDKIVSAMMQEEPPGWTCFLFMAFAERNMEQLGLRRKELERLNELGCYEYVKALLPSLKARGWITDRQRKEVEQHLIESN